MSNSDTIAIWPPAVCATHPRRPPERALRILEKAFGTEDHPNVVASLHTLARVLLAQGDHTGAGERLERSVDIQKKVFGTEDHPKVAASLHTLAEVFLAKGDLPGARCGEVGDV
jgi:hypothetical protein